MTTLLTVDEAAELLNVHKETIRRQIRKGALPAIKVGTVYRISVDDLTPTRAEAAPPAARQDDSPLARFVRPEWRHPNRAGR